MPEVALTFFVFVCRARAIGYRQHNSEAVGGFFSQIGNLYMVHHLWGTDTPQLERKLQIDIVRVDDQSNPEIFSSTKNQVLTTTVKEIENI